MGKNRWNHVSTQDVGTKHNINTYNEMVKFSQEKTGEMVDSIMPAIRMYGGPDFRFMFKKMMIKKGYKFTKEIEELELVKKVPTPRSAMNKTGVRDCYLERGKYRVQVSVNGKRKYVGRFDTLEKAYEARKSYIEENGLKNKI